MTLENILSVDREKYWQNRFWMKCVRCGMDLSINERSQQTDIYRYENCGHQTCVECYEGFLENGNEECYCYACHIYTGDISIIRPVNFIDEYREYRIEALQLLEEYHDNLKELKKCVEEKNRKQTELEEEIISLRENMNSTKNIDTTVINYRCKDCGYAIAFEKSRICVTCGVEHGIISKESKEGKIIMKISSFDKAEIVLLCGSCILEGKHEGHETMNYFNMKTTQLSISDTIEMNRRLNDAFDIEWDNICLEMKECHIPVVKFLEKNVNTKQDSWEDFKKEQFKRKNIVERVIANKTNMVGHMHEYTSNMKNLLAEAQAVLQDVKRSHSYKQSMDGPTS